jgi:L-tartrate/succinate antiporter
MVTSSMFVTALAPKALAMSLIAKIINVTIPWLDWFKGFAPVGILLLLVTPILLYKIYPPAIKEAPEAPRWAADQLRQMGPVTRPEITLLVLVILALTLWIGATAYLDAAMGAIVVVVLMVLVRVVSWNDIIGHAQAWNVLIWFATLVTLASGLVETGFVAWFSQSIAPALSGLSLYTTIVGLLAAFYFTHYFFASITAHTAALFPVFLAIAVEIPGVSPTRWALLLGYSLGLMGILTTYGSGQAAIYYGSGYIKRKDFFVLGLVMGLVFFIVYVGIIVPWLAFLGI